MFPGKGNLNNIGLHYSNAGKKDKAIIFYERAMDKSPSSTTAFNIAMQYKNSDKKKYKEYLQKAREINSSDNTVAYNLGQELRNDGKSEEGTKLLQEAFDRWQKQFELSNKLAKWEYSWFSSCARALGKIDYAEHIEQSEPKEDLDKMYNTDNLTQFKQEDGLLKL